MKHFACVVALLASIGCGKKESSSSSSGPQTTPPKEVVVINGKTLANADLDALKARYGVYPVAGTYWYDPKSGLFGLVGKAAGGFMYADHDFGALAANASAGDTGVFLNGRELPKDEYTFFSALAGQWIAAGRYWMDARGNTGYEGNPTPVGNLYVAVQSLQRSGGGAPGGHGDNFWWSRFSSGNYTDDNSAGYVHLPDGGFVSYGM